MKTMRKIFTLVLAMTILLSMVVTANATAADPAPAAMNNTGLLTIQNATAGYVYSLYRILDLETISSDGKPVYIMRADGLWDDFFTDAEYGAPYFEVSGKYVKEIKTTNPELTGQMLAEKVLAYAQANSIAADVSGKISISGDYRSGTPRQYGYYVMATDRAGTSKYTTFTLMTPTMSILEKNAQDPSIEKFVQEDSEMGTGDSGWKDDDDTIESNRYNVAEIEQPVKFKIIVNLKAGTDKYTITDTMPNFEGLSDLSFDFSGGGTIDDSRVEITSTENSFTVVLKDNFRATIEDGQTLTITYTAKLKSNANIGTEGNENEVVLSYGDGKTDDDQTYTKTYSLTVTKVDELNQPLDGAIFQLFHENSDHPLHFGQNGSNYTITNSETNGSDIVDTIIPDGTTCTFTINGLDTVDKYILKEIKVPDGYVKMDDQVIVIDPSSANFDPATDTVSIDIQNLPGVTMPETGGMGTTVFYVTGGILVLAAIALLVTKKRMSV